MTLLKSKYLCRRCWLRQVLNLRQSSVLKNILLLTFLVLIFTQCPNPFSSYYRSISLNQEVRWENIEELLKLKDEIEISEPIDRRIKFVTRGNSELISNSTIVVLLYTKVFRSKKFCTMKSEEIFGDSCPVKNRCEWSCDKKRIEEADAIIFHAFDLISSGLKVPPRSKTKKTAVWILWSDEPPSIIDYKKFEGIRFNWTIGYRLRSEVSIGVYGLFSKREKSMSEENFQRWIDVEFSRRKRGALWLVSNCKAKKRLEIFNDLQRLSKINVEGYGRCVDWFPIHWCGSYTPCEREYAENFKFYFSFESNTCTDYITEKFYKAFHYKMIPIVSGPSKQNYERFSPESSFIHVEQFNDDRQDLADFLDQVDRNRSLFAEFHRWRKDYQVVVEGKALERIRMCELCWRLTQIRQGQSTFYENLHEFYTDQCDRIIN